ncbi:MAG: hypothetical protein OEV28_13285, partial [Nitrospirota bacterium]|nr:hypothetical protein [Nitrospirota bacterium]
EVEKPADMPGLLVSLQEEARYGLVAVEERLLDEVPDVVMRRIRKKGVPIIIPVNLPQSWGEVEYGESPVVKLIRKAIGYQIKIKK